MFGSVFRHGSWQCVESSMYKTSADDIKHIEDVVRGAQDEKEIRRRIAHAFPLSRVGPVKQQPSGWALLMYPVYPLGEEIEIRWNDS
ncbi:MAG: hypothetical protein JWN18_164 [Parcubacteria group bacterium]|nr:hypothetical protein [Parcubacteria group bacterium]